MKKIYISIIAILSAYQFTYAQNTSPFPASGSVGIGTISPQGGLDIYNVGNYWSSYNIGTNLLIRGTTHNNAIGIFDATNSNPWAVVNSGGALFFSQMPALGDVTTNPTLRVAFIPNGNVGIGTTIPVAKLHVAGNISLAAAAGPTNTYLSFQRDYDSYTGARIGNAYSMNGYQGHLVFETNNGGGPTSLTEQMRITSLGNVGIGTSNPDSKLTVKGTVHSLAVIVDNNIVPDYVFKPTYKLPSLKNVKTYIEKNHHLEEIPSAKTVAKLGMNLGDMNTLLLKKVEELTLYTIASDKEIKDEEAIITQQNLKLKKQQAEIDLLIQQVSKLSNEITR